MNEKIHLDGGNVHVAVSIIMFKAKNTVRRQKLPPKSSTLIGRFFFKAKGGKKCLEKERKRRKKCFIGEIPLI